jgi:hypothetical protein
MKAMPFSALSKIYADLLAYFTAEAATARAAEDALAESITAGLETAQTHTDTALTRYLTEEEIYAAIAEAGVGLWADKGSVPTRAELPTTAANFDMYLIMNEGEPALDDGNPVLDDGGNPTYQGLRVYAENATGALLWHTLNFTVNLADYESTAGATEKAIAAQAAAKAYTDTVAAHKIDTLTIGTVTTIAPDTPASASVSVSGGVGTLNMSIPKGEQGTNTVIENTSGIPLLLSPHKWTVGQEYVFGDGSYGQRFTGTVTAAANALNYVLIITSTLAVISQGGWVAPDNNGRKASLPSSNVVSISGDVRMECSIYAGTANAYLASKSNQARTDAPYDVWVRYTKA